MLQHLVLDPKLGLEPGAIVTAWNGDPTCCGRAEAKLGHAAPGDFIDPTLAAALVSFAVSVAGGLTKDLLLDFIRAKLPKKDGKAPVVEIEQRELPSGERLMIARLGPG
jgi:hypothetical protein